MYAVIEQKGRQYTVKEGDILLVDRLDLEKGSEIIFDRVLAKAGSIGTPFVEGASVSGVVLESLVKGKKVYTLKYRRRKASSKSLQGHRQKYSRIRIEKIS